MKLPKRFPLIFLKFVVSCLLLAVPVAFITLTSLCQYFVSTANSACNCMSERIIMARVSFEHNYDFVAILYGFSLMLLAAGLSAIPWTKIRIINFGLAVLVAFVAWQTYPQYVHLIPDTSTDKWFNLPIITIAPGTYSEVAKSLAELQTWYWGCTIGAGLISLISGELLYLGYEFFRKFRTKQPESYRAQAQDFGTSP